MPQKTQRAITHTVGELQYFPDQGDYNYEVTITFNPRLYNRVTEFTALPNLVETLNTWLADSPFQISSTTFVMEYTKAKRLHLHINVSSDEPISPTFRGGCIKGLEREYGRSTFNDVADRDKWYEYLNKDLQKNYDDKGFVHYEQYFFS